jgi:putative transposase
MATVAELGATLGVMALCAALGIARASFYRTRRTRPPASRRTSPPRALSTEERQQVLALLHEPRFVDLSPAEVYATLLDEGSYLCSERTMYRILVENHEVRERRDQLRHPSYAPPELLATAPNQVWSWDITKLRGPTKWSYFHLYAILDVYSRYVVGWMIADRESATLAQRLIAETCERQAIRPDQLTLHADRGSSMKSKAVALLLADLGVTKTHSRPHVSDDNPYSEAQFKTLKYRPDFPERFGCIEDARAHCRAFFDWYNAQHHHAGVGLFTPHDVHHGLAQLRRDARARVLAAAHAAHPERFPHGLPTPADVPAAVWINKPKSPIRPIEEAAR